MFICELFDQLPDLINKTVEVEGIRLSINTNAKNASLYATSNGRRLGYVEFDRDGNTLLPYDLAVDDKYRGQGIAAVMYDYAKSLGFTIKASAEQTNAGKYFWSKNRGEERVWEGEVVDMLEEGYRELSDMLEGKPNVIESADSWKTWQALTNQLGGEQPVIGKDYSAINLIAMVPGNWLLIRGHQTPATLTDIIKNSTYTQYEFNINGKTFLYPNEHRAGDRLSKTILYKNAAEIQKALTVINLSIGDWEIRTKLSEVTLVPSVAKSKREHLDVMPNDGRPIPPGEESNYMGNLVAEMGNGLQLWSWVDRGTVTYYVFDTKTHTSQLGTTGRPYKTNRDSFVIQGVYSGPDNHMRAADLYAFLIFNRGLTLVSDNKQSEGGYRVWQELEKRYGRRLNIHGFDTKTNEPVNVTTQDEPDTHVARADVKRAGPQMKRELGTISRDLRFVASAK